MTRETRFRSRKRYFIWNERMRHFMHSPWAGGVVLVIFAFIALILANLEATRGWYHHLFANDFTVGFEGFGLRKTLEEWINDGLMAVFFFYVGLEIKREIIAGQLSHVKRAVMPVAAALGGMVVPAAIYMTINNGTPYESGWGIPMATDIAFAIGVISLLGNRVPLSLKIFLTALAIVDDLGAILVIAVFYSSRINFALLGFAALIVLLLVAFNRLNVYRMRYYLIPSIVLWVLFLHSGVHATISGVIIAMTLPSTPRFTKRYFLYKSNYSRQEFSHYDREGVEVLGNSRQLHTLMSQRTIAGNAISPLQRLEYSLHPFVSFFIMPVFALANAGVTVAGIESLHVMGQPLGPGICLGLVAGKPVGIFLFSYLVYRFGWGQLPEGATWRSLFGVACLGGIGFTMSIFIDNLAFSDPSFINSGKIAILMASFLSAIIGLLWLRLMYKPRPAGR